MMLIQLRQKAKIAKTEAIAAASSAKSAEAFRLVTGRTGDDVVNARSGDHVVIERISEDAENDRDLLSFFQRSGLLPGREFDVSEIEPYNSLIVLHRGADSIPVSFPVAHKVWVRRVG